MPTPQELKLQLLAHCRAETDARILGIADALASIETARNGETKSSAGDKFETGRAMMQIEEAKLNHQLSEAIKVREVLDQIKPGTGSGRIASGSLVATNRGNYFLAVGLGKVKLAGRTFFCTSLESPIGQLLHGREVGDAFEFNELSFEVLGVV